MTAAGGTSAGGAPREEMSVLITEGAGEPDRLIMLGRPSLGAVHVREWSTDNWNAAPVERDTSVSDAMAVFRAAYDARRRMSVSLQEIRSWLEGRL